MLDIYVPVGVIYRLTLNAGLKVLKCCSVIDGDAKDEIVQFPLEFPGIHPLHTEQ